MQTRLGWQLCAENMRAMRACIKQRTLCAHPKLEAAQAELGRLARGLQRMQERRPDKSGEVGQQARRGARRQET